MPPKFLLLFLTCVYLLALRISKFLILFFLKNEGVKAYDFNTNTSADFGYHAQGAKCAEYAASHGMLITGSWDKTMKCWDPRSPGAEVGTYQMPDKVYSTLQVG